MTIFKWENENKEITIDLCFQITSWMGVLSLGQIAWWTTKDVLGHRNIQCSLNFLCFSLHIEYWDFGNK